MRLAVLGSIERLMRSISAVPHVAAVAAAFLCAAAASPALGQVYSFAGFSWDQADTPDVAFPLAPGTFDGATMTGLPGDTTSAITGFPLSTTNFDSSLTLGRKLGLSGTGSRAVNLPLGNDGTTARSGFQLSWSAGRRMRNQSGNDFVVYESASNGTSPEGFMVQVRNASTATWSRWYYDIQDGFETYVGIPSEGAFATAYDLDNFGVGAFEEIDAIRIANLTDDDRLDGPGTEVSPGIFVGTGFVRPGDAGATSNVLPDPGPFASFLIYGASTLDPDPLYLGALTPPNACGDGVTRDGEQCDDGNTTNFDGCSSTCQLEARQSSPQQTCIKAINTAASRVADTQLRVARGCLNAATLDVSSGAQSCLTTDADGRIAGVRAQTVGAQRRACRILPDFGQSDPVVTNDAAQSETLGLIGDVFGSDLGAAAILQSTDEMGALCQNTMFKSFRALAAVKRRIFLLCKRTGLKTGAVVSSAGVEQCLTQMTLDPSAKVLAARRRIDRILQGQCATVDLATAFPGSCSAALASSTCLDQRVNCRVCRTFRTVDVLTLDCDSFDDGTRNGSCPQ